MDDINSGLSTAAFADQTLITVDFNTNDGELTKILQNLTHEYVVIHDSMYNYTSSVSVKDLEWAILQGKKKFIRKVQCRSHRIA